MSIYAVAWALRQNVGDATAKLILISIADHHNESTGDCFPSKPTLAVAGSCSLATVKRKLALLVRDGWVKPVRKYGKGGRHCRNFYVLEGLKKSVAQIEPPNPPEASGGGSAVEPHEGVRAVSPLNYKKNRKKDAQASASDETSPTVLNDDRHAEIAARMKALQRAEDASPRRGGGRPMKRFRQIWWYSTVAGAVTAMAVYSISRPAPIVTPRVTVSPAVLTPAEAPPWMRGPVAAGQPGWITEASHGDR